MKDEQLKPDHHEDAKKIIKFISSVEPINERKTIRKKRIIETLKAELQAGNIEMIHTNIEQLAEKLALPLDVPDKDEILTAPFHSDDLSISTPINSAFRYGAIWAIEAIKKRNS